MANFFEKVTGAKPEAETADIGPEIMNGEVEAEAASIIDKDVLTQLTAKKPAMRRPASPVAKPKPTQLKVEPEETPAVKEEKEDVVEEEGELTVDIYDQGDAIVIQSTVAGVKPENLDVSITTDTVTIRGRREKTDEVKEENYYYKELFWGSFSRSVILPEEIDDTAAEASMKHGLLTIRLPKKRKGIAQKLKVRVT